MERLCLVSMPVNRPFSYTHQWHQGGSISFLAPSGYLKPRQLQDTSKATNDARPSKATNDARPSKATNDARPSKATNDARPRPPKSIIEQKMSINEHSLFEEEGTSPLDLFIMLRTGRISPEIAKSFESSSQDRGMYYMNTWP